MKVFHQNKYLQDQLNKIRALGSIGFVPTMGALHEGHLSLIKKAKTENDFVVVSIFVNPTQFDKKADLYNYPKSLDQDVKLLKSVTCDFVFVPTVQEIYQNDISSSHYNFGGLELEMEGKFRKGHFDGVATIVKKLFELVMPDRAYFGEKDFQQLQIVIKLTKKLKIPVEIVGCAIHREKDGLAMSSRNKRLTELQRKEAPSIFEILQMAKKKFEKESILNIENWVKNEFKKNHVLELEYFVIAKSNTLKQAERKRKKSSYRGFIAVFAGEVRLIDNISFN
jgi:pantoate--beta-alanine ligase